jgi:hypothetical protein
VRVEVPPKGGLRALCPLLRYTAVVTTPVWRTRAAELRSLDPRIATWEARSLLYTCDQCDLAGFGLAWIEAHHPEWILRAASGNEVHPAHHPSWVLLDFGSQAYVAAWSQRVRQSLTVYGYTGVAVDDAGNSPRWSEQPIDPRTGLPLTENDRATYLAQALSLIHADMRTHGFFVMAENGPPAVVEPAQINSADAVSAGDGFAELRGTAWLAALRYYLQAQRDRVGTYVWQDQPAHGSGVVYGLASYLLVATPTGAYGGPVPPGIDLGTPPDTPPTLAGAAWVRAYPRGAVAVNPSHKAVTVEMGSVGSVILPPDTAAISDGTRVITSF